MAANEEALRAAQRRAGVREAVPEVRSVTPREVVSEETHDAMLIAALYLSKFGHERLELGNQDQTFARVAERLHVKKNTLKNHRDRFDPHTGSGRRGWWQAGLPSDVAGALRDYGTLTEAELRERVIRSMR